MPHGGRRPSHRRLRVGRWMTVSVATSQDLLGIAVSYDPGRNSRASGHLVRVVRSAASGRDTRRRDARTGNDECRCGRKPAAWVRTQARTHACGSRGQ